MSRTAVVITADHLRNQEIVAADLLRTAVGTEPRRTAVSTSGEPLSVFGRKVVGHGG